MTPTYSKTTDSNEVLSAGTNTLENRIAYNADPDNYEYKEVTLTITIVKKEVTVAWTYNGEAWTDDTMTVEFSKTNFANNITATYVDSDNNNIVMQLSYKNGSTDSADLYNAGTYYIKATPVTKKQVDGVAIDFDKNYNFTGAIKTLIINKATVKLSQDTFEVDHADDNDAIKSITPTVVDANNTKIGTDNYTLGFVTNDNSVGFTIDSALTRRNGRIMDSWTIGFTDGGTWKLSVTLSSQNYEMAETEITIKVNSVVLSDDTSTLRNIDDELNKDASDQTIIVKYDTFINQNAEIKTGVTLLVPYAINSDGSFDTTIIQPTTQTQITSSSVYRTLTLSKSLNIYGTLNIVGLQSAKNGYRYSGFATGPCGYMKLLEDSEIYVYGSLYASGYINGKGLIYIKSEGKAYENLDIKDWPGGTMAMAIYSDFFPFTQYAVANIEAKTRIEYGATLYAHYALTVKLASETTFQGNIKMFGSGGLFTVTDSNGYIEKEVNDKGKIIITVKGTIQTQDISVSVSLANVSTEGKEIPICGYYKLIVSENSTVNVKSRLKLMPGSSLTIKENAYCYIYATNYGIIAYEGEKLGNIFPNSDYIGKSRENLTVYDGDDDVQFINNGTITVYEESYKELSWSGFKTKWRGGWLGGNITTTVNGSQIILSEHAVVTGQFGVSVDSSNNITKVDFALKSNGNALSANKTYTGNGTYFG